VSGYVALCRPLPGAVVTYFVTDSQTPASLQNALLPAADESRAA
jgi:hypothetical protein